MMITIDKRYPDVLGEKATPQRTRLLADLDRLGAGYFPAADLRASMVEGLREQITAQTPRPAMRRRFPLAPRSRRSLLLVAALLTVGAIVGSAAALDNRPLEDQALSWSSEDQTGTARILQQHLGLQFNLGKSVCGYTVTIKRVYADRYNVVVAATLNGLPGRQFTAGGDFYAYTTMTDHQGHVFPGGVGLTTPPAAQGVGVLATYIATGLARSANTLSLQLKVSSIVAMEQLKNTPPVTRRCETYSKPYVDDPAHPKGGMSRYVTVNGPLIFALALPIDRRLRTVTPARPETVGGTTLTLRQVEITPIQARIIVSGVSSGAVFAELSVDKHGQRKTTKWTDEGVHRTPLTAVFDAPLYTYHGSMTLRLRAMTRTNGRPTIPGGPWVFHFTLP